MMNGEGDWYHFVLQFDGFRHRLLGLFLKAGCFAVHSIICFESCGGWQILGFEANLIAGG